MNEADSISAFHRYEYSRKSFSLCLMLRGYVIKPRMNESNLDLDHRAPPCLWQFRIDTRHGNTTGKEFDNILTMRSNLYSTIE